MHPSGKIASMVAGGIPPTVSIGTEAAITARSALMATAGMIPAGKSLRECAPAWMAAKASVGVATPGSQTRPAARVAAYTPGARFLAAISLPSGFATASTSVAVSAVRAPDDHAGSESCTQRGDAPRRGGRVHRSLIRVILAPASSTTSASASSGRMPRRIATSGQVFSTVAHSKIRSAVRVSQFQKARAGSYLRVQPSLSPRTPRRRGHSAPPERRVLSGSPLFSQPWLPARPGSLRRSAAPRGDRRFLPACAAPSERGCGPRRPVPSARPGISRPRRPCAGKPPLSPRPAQPAARGSNSGAGQELPHR